MLVIDDCGELRESTRAYDRRVAGVVSGGGSFGPGIVLDKQRGLGDRKPRHERLAAAIAATQELDVARVALHELELAADLVTLLVDADRERLDAALRDGALAELVEDVLCFALGKHQSSRSPRT